MTTQHGQAPADDRGTLPLVMGLLLFAPIALVGNAIGSIVTHPEVGAAILFPPYAALTAALVVSSRRDWVWYILVGSFAHLITHWPQWPLPWVLFADVANIARALTASVLLGSLFDGAPPRLNSIRALLVFVLSAVLVAPAVGATIGAANVVFHDAAATYWRPWSAWFVSNALTGLAMMPATIAAFAFATGFRRFRFEAGRAAEALLMAIALAVTCAVAFLGVVDPRHLVLPLYAPLPVLIWAALRFGSGGASLALTAVAFAAILRADDGMGPFLSVSPDDNLIALQTFVLLTAAPVLCLAAIATARQEMAEGYRTLLTSVQDKETALRTSYGQVRQLANRLMTAQEEERTRIARELHDDFGQRIASLSIGLSAAKWDVKEMDNALGDKLSVLQQQMMTVAKDLRSLSHELHPSAFEHVGFVEALRARCDEVSLESGLNVRLDASEDCSSVLRDDAALCLYRIAQEALQNVVKHAHATSARVSLARHNGAIVMRVIDDGLGFEAAGSRNHPGLGLLSIRERVHMLGGRFEMRTSPGAGTIAEVTLPVGERG